MTCNEFIENLSELNDSTDFPRDLLRNIYYAIKQEPIPWAAATEEDLGTLIPNELVPQPSGMGGQASGHLPGLTNSSSQQVSSRSNSELDKISSRSNGDQSNVPINTTTEIEIGDNKGGVNPFLSLPDPASSTDYKKEQFVFRLHTADQAQYLFQTSDEKELLTWIG